MQAPRCFLGLTHFHPRDGTVPALSLGYMCAPSGGWTKHADLYNPAHIPVVLKEYKHEESESKLDVRGGRKAGDHVDILGNWEMIVSPQYEAIWLGCVMGKDF